MEQKVQLCQNQTAWVHTRGLRGTEGAVTPHGSFSLQAVAASAQVLLVLRTLWSHALISLQTDPLDAKQVFQYGLPSVPSLLLTQRCGQKDHTLKFFGRPQTVSTAWQPCLQHRSRLGSSASVTGGGWSPFLSPAASDLLPPTSDPSSTAARDILLSHQPSSTT